MKFLTLDGVTAEFSAEAETLMLLFGFVLEFDIPGYFVIISSLI